MFQVLKSEIPPFAVFMHRYRRRFVIRCVIIKRYVSFALVQIFSCNYGVNDLVVESKFLVENDLHPKRKWIPLLLVVDMVIVALTDRRHLATRLNVRT